MELVFVVAGRLRSCPAAWWDALLGPKPGDHWSECDGCTASPERIGPYVLWPACRIHDWQCASAVVPRVVADLIFRVNVWRLVRLQGGTVAEAVAISGPYWIGASVGAVLGIGRPK